MMHKTNIKRIVSLLLLLTFSNILPQYTIKHYVIGAVAALVIGKIAYNYYVAMQNKENIQCVQGDTCEQCIEKCQSIYQTIYQDVQKYHYCYSNDARISDWDLKEIILCNNQKPCPFTAYHSSIIQAHVTLQTHHVTIQKELVEINKYKKKLETSPQSAITDYLHKILIQLEIEGNNLQDFILKTMTSIVILQNRIELFKEYKDDCYSSSSTSIFFS